MNDYIISVDENGTPSLQHYGILGMKWGVRHDPRRAYEKASNKARKYQKKIDKYTTKANKKFSQGVSKSGGMFSSQKGAAKAFAKSSKYSRKALSKAQKGAKWIDRMKKEFAKQSVVSIDPAIIKLGESYTNRITTAADQMYLRNL